MDSLKNYRQIVKQLLAEYSEIPVVDKGIQNATLFDVESDRYMLINIGWFNEQRIHHCVIHIDIIDGQVWIQANNTDRLIAEELVAAGIPAKSIVLGLQPPDVRSYTAYGVPCREMATAAQECYK
ncbi:MAG: XisI protein [Microcoleus sp. PH2017_10_PVI_O_A]|uniref:XisI protein n=1 Tax=unclassified Microcoleus TaxID=2642155 RepID=UPI001DA8DEC3|nr:MULTISPECIES: XisI protein [unclassified Microcoleus]TAE84109.1 MAG: XisI protein [Oscillatoriales cyanobacterium]MCC3405566.1 XisI protein [Microcoleus sp. PH2017_10_PVI_O_A]MCC3459666.1 XisI protein [Microcoleus sp. PH2017_11_PCY_U_A]MCC3478031.1 XisI protein [Microcoleus sp. PH2017_12_PCY_D_A]MCC3559020.1 XisI protein [Microcoleus sp. PH2017_27_LUM_O_A]